MIINTQHPYCCEECGAELGTLMMQHFSKRTIVLGACTTPGCTKQHSHQAAEVIPTDARTLAALTAISQRLNIAIGVFEFAYADALKVEV